MHILPQDMALTDPITMAPVLSARWITITLHLPMVVATK